MKISYTLELEDVIALQKHLLRFSKQQIILKNITRILVPIVLAGIIVLKLINQTVISQTQIMLFGGFAIFWIVLHELFFEKIMFRKIIKTVTSQKENLGLGKNSVEIKTEGLLFQQNKESLILPWRRFKRIDETMSHLFLIVGEFAGITINKKTADKADFKFFIANFKENI